MLEQAAGLRRTNGRIIPFFSSASATGKTTLALNLATQLKREDCRTVVVDMDLQFGDVCNYLKLQPSKSVYDYQLALEKDRVADISAFLISGPQVPDILPAPLDIAEAYHIRTSTVVRLLGELKSSYDYVFVDLSTGFNDANLRILEAADTICFVSLVDFLPTVKNMKIAYDTLYDIGITGEKIKLVLNRNNAQTDIPLADVEPLLGRNFFHTLPNDFVQSAAAIKKGLPVILSAPNSSLTSGICELAEKLTGRVGKVKKANGVKKWFSGFLKE